MTIQLILDILFVVVAVAIIAICAKRGFIKSLLHSAKLLFAVILAYVFGGQLGAFLNQHFIGASVRNFVYEKINGLYTSASSSLNIDEIAAKFPDFIMTEELKQTISNATAEESGEALVSSVTESISVPISTLISNIVGYIAVFIVSFILLIVVAWLLTKVIDKIAFLGTANHILGGVWGALIALILLFIAASVIKVFLGGTAGYDQTVIVKFFGDSALLEVIKILDVGGTWFAKLTN